MRITALVCGLIAGLFVLALPYAFGVDLMTPFLAAQDPGAQHRALWTAVWYAAPVAAMLGGLMAIVVPGFGTLLMLGAVMGWLGITVGDPALFRLELLGPSGVAALGALLSFFGGELDVHQRRAARRDRRAAREEANEERLEEKREREAAFSIDPRTMPREPTPPRPIREIPLTLDDVVVTARTAEPAKLDETIWPEPTALRPSVERPDPGPELARRLPLAERIAATREVRAEDEPRPPRPVRYGDEPRPGPGALFISLAAINGVALLALGVAVGYLVIDRQSVPAAPVAAVVDVATTPAAPVAVVTPKQPPEAEVKVVTTPLLPMAADPAKQAAAGGYADPFAYCTAVGTIDVVDGRYAGPAFTADIANALRVPLKSSPDRVRWRCVDGAVYACASFDWPGCAMTPTAEEMRDYCQRNPGVARLLAPNGTWSCDGDQPRIPDGERWPVDARGFLPSAWIPVLPTGTQPTG